MKDFYELQITKALQRVTLDAATGDINSQLLQERLSLEYGRQQRLARVQKKRVQMGLPDTLQGRTEALEALGDE